VGRISSRWCLTSREPTASGQPDTEEVPLRRSEQSLTQTDKEAPKQRKQRQKANGYRLITLHPQGGLVQKLSKEHQILKPGKPTASPACGFQLNDVSSSLWPRKQKFLQGSREPSRLKSRERTQHRSLSCWMLVTALPSQDTNTFPPHLLGRARATYVVGLEITMKPASVAQRTPADVEEGLTTCTKAVAIH